MTRQSPTQSIWSDPRNDEILRAGWAAGHLMADIAKRIGTTRSAVGARARRLHLPAHPNAYVPPAGGRPERPKPVSRMSVTFEKPRDAAPMPRRAYGQCCWLDGVSKPYLQCSEPAVRGSYCEWHAAKAYIARCAA